MKMLHYHPLYVRYAPHWQEQRDAYLGGTDYLRPMVGSESYEDRPRFYDKDDPDSMAYARTLASTRTDAITRPLPRASYLYAHPRESNATWLNRTVQSFFLRTGGSIVDLYAAYVGESKATYGSARGRNRWLAELDADATLTGQGLGAYVREQTAWAQVYGVTHTLVVRPGIADLAPDMSDGSVSAASAIRQLRPYLVPIHPIDLVAWQVDGRGRWIWAAIAEHPPIASEWGSAPSPAIDQYLVIDRQSWQRWRRAAQGQSLEMMLGPGDAGVHGLGEVPLVSYYEHDHAHIAEPIGHGRMETLAPIDRAIYNRLSERTDYLRRWAMAQLAMSASDLQRLSRDGIVVGNEYVLPYDNQLPQIIETAGKAYEALTAEIGELVHQMRLLSGLSRGQAEESSAARSGVALRFERAHECASLRQLTTERERFERSLARMVVRVGDGTEPGEDIIAVSVCKDYDIDAIGDELERATALEKLTALAPAVLHAHARRLEGSILSELPIGARAKIEAEAMRWHEAQTDASGQPLMAERQLLGQYPYMTVDEIRSSMGLGPGVDGGMYSGEWQLKHAPVPSGPSEPTQSAPDNTES